MTQNFKLPKNYVNNNPNIIKRIEHDIKVNKEFHYLFIGVVGSGKTYLATSLSKTMEGVKYLSARQVYRDYLNIMMSDFTDKVSALNKKIHCMRGKYVILDDLGAEKPKTESSRAFMEEILEDRYEWIKKKLAICTIITTNLTGKEITSLYGNRVLDRLHEVFTIMKFNKYSFRNANVEIIEG